jgi:hypothetical protein
MIHGLTAHHMANEPELPIGSGRFGSQIPAAIALFRTKWEPKETNGWGPDARQPEKGGERSRATRQKRHRP